MAIIIDGKQIAQSVKEQLKDKVKDFLAKYNHQITLAVILVGENPASKVYVKNKITATEYVGMKSLSFHLPESSTQEEVENLVESLSKDNGVDGILVQLPLPKHLDENKILSKIPANKDVDELKEDNSSGIYIGADAPLDDSVDVWIDTDEEPEEPTVGKDGVGIVNITIKEV